MSTIRRFPMPVWNMRFSSRIRASAVAEFLRSWRVVRQSIMRSRKLCVRALEWTHRSTHWTLSASGAWSSGRSFHAYDNVTLECHDLLHARTGMGQEQGSETVSRLSHEIFFRHASSKVFTIFPDRAHPSGSGRRSSLFEGLLPHEPTCPRAAILL